MILSGNLVNLFERGPCGSTTVSMHSIIYISPSSSALLLPYSQIANKMMMMMMLMLMQRRRRTTMTMSKKRKKMMMTVVL